VTAATELVCAGCGLHVADDDPAPFRCHAAAPDDDIDHVVERRSKPGRVSGPEGDDPNPSVRYRTLMHAYHVAREGGLSDDEYVGLVRDLDDRIAGVDGVGLRVTQLVDAHRLASEVGVASLRVKDETGNVSGSHKARHLMGVLVWLEVAERLAIASCGNAALAAAVLARAAGRPLDVFVPTWADPVVVSRLKELEGAVTVCERAEGVPGDPSYHRMRQAVDEGAIPFTCQGSENGLAVEGGLTIGYEIVDQIAGGELDHLVVQVGGGALASALIQGLKEGVTFGALGRMPAIHTVQTRGAAPLERAYRLIVADAEGPGGVTGLREAALERAARHRSAFMWPWELEPRSVAHGILDDETYDWLAVVRGMLATGGVPVVVSEEELEDANRLAREMTGIDVDHSGSAGLAGLRQLVGAGTIGVMDRAAVLFTGARRP